MTDHELNQCISTLEKQVKDLTIRQLLLAVCVLLEAIIITILVV